MPTTLDDLPQELWNRIVHLFYSDRQTLLILCLTSARFVDEAQSRLYSTIFVTTKVGCPLPRIHFSKAPKLFSTFIHNPALANYVKTLEYDHNEELREDPGYEDFRHALRLMVNLTWLEINRNCPGIPHDFFSGCTFRLKHFRCNFSSPDNTEIYNLLSSQPTIGSLYLDGLTPGDFPSNCCPNLKRLIISNWKNVQHALPGRFIYRLEILQIEPSFDCRVPPSITSELGNLTLLVYQCHIPDGSPYDFIKNVAPYLTHLSVLRIITTDDREEKHTICKEPEILYKLTNLRTLIWSPQLYHHRACDDIWLSDQVEKSVKKWYRNLPKLKEIYCRNYVGDEGLHKYFGWARNLKRVVMQDDEEVLGGRWLYSVSSDAAGKREHVHTIARAPK